MKNKLNREEARKVAEVMLAYADRKDISCLNTTSSVERLL